MRVNFNATMDEMEQSAGSCEAMAKTAEGAELRAFLAGAAAGIDLLTTCRKPDALGSLLAVEFESVMSRIGEGGAA
ncbi:MAG: hypothetical protein E7C06_04395 [Eggerthella lenta]|nr:hypothetical protein [Eggerthella lenta]